MPPNPLLAAALALPSTVSTWWLGLVAFVLGGYLFNALMANRRYRQQAARYRGLWLDEARRRLRDATGA